MVVQTPARVRTPRPDVDRTLGALADPVRRRAVERLRDGPLCASELATGLGLTRPTMSRHLRELRRAGLVEENGDEGDARLRIYALRQSGFSQLGDWLAGVQAFWGLQLAAFETHVEERAGREPTRGKR